MTADITKTLAPDCSTTFNNELTQLEADATTFHDDSKLIKKEGVYGTETIKKMVEELAKKYKDNPEELLEALMIKIYGGKVDAHYQGLLKQQADAVQIQSDITGLTNNIQNTVNAGGDAKLVGHPNTDKGLANVAAETDVMQDILGGTGVLAQHIKDALGSEATSLMCQNFKNVRNDINWENDPEKALYNPASGYHFDANTEDTTYINSYQELKEDMKKQGDQKGAQAANTTLLDSYRQNVSTTESLGTASNAIIGNITSHIKMNTSFLSDCAQNILTGNRTAIKDQIAQ